MSEATIVLADAESLVDAYESVNSDSKMMKAPLLKQMKITLQKMENFNSIKVPESFTDKFQYFIRYLKDTLFLEGYINSIQ